MIEINLSPREKDTNLSNIGGINLSLINVKMLLIAIFVLYFPEMYLEGYFKDELTSYEDKSRQLTKEYRRLSIELKEVKEIENQVSRLEAQEKELNQKIDVVRAIVAKRQNPFKVLKYVAQSTPEDVWIKQMTIEESQFEMTGYTTSWKSMGDFFENLKNSIFFSREIEFDQAKDLKNEYGKRVETFSIKTRIERFE